MFREILSVVFFPFYLLLILPVLFVCGIFGKGLVLLNFSNADFLAFIDKKIKKRRVVFYRKEPNQTKQESSATRLFAHLDDLFVYEVPASTTDELFQTKIVDSGKQAALNDIRNLVEAIYRNGEALSLHDLQSRLTKIDLKHKTRVTHYVIEEKGNFPNFLRTDVALWESLFEIYFDAVIEDHGLEMFLELETKPDLPGKQITNRLKTFEDEYLSRMVIDQPIDQQVRYYLWRYEQTSREENSALIAEKFGDWVYLTCPDARHFLRSVVFANLNVDTITNAEELDFALRHILYGLLQAADAELIQRVSVAFKRTLNSIDISDLDDQSEFGKFLAGSFPPTMAGVARFLDQFRKSQVESRNPIQKEFLKFVENTDYLSIDHLTNKRFIQKLYLMGRLRGSIMHPGKFNREECDSVVSYLINGKLPGEFFYKIGIDIGF